MNSNKFLLSKYNHAWVFLYTLIYLPWFSIIERLNTSNYHLIHSPLDDLIPFCEYFVIPYYIWFPYMLVVCLYIFFTSKEDFYKLSIVMISGMTIFLIFSTLFPNGHTLRPTILPNNNLCSRLVSFTYSIDTPTNILPSIHVYNSIGSHIAIMKSSRLNNHPWIRRISFVIAVSIILSTVFIKQHSVIDGFLAIGLISIMYPIAYLFHPRVSRTVEQKCQFN